MTIAGGNATVGCGGNGVSSGKWPKKKQRTTGSNNTRYPSTIAVIDGGESLTDLPHYKPSTAGILRRSASNSHFPTTASSSSTTTVALAFTPTIGGFNDSSTSDVILRLYLEGSSDDSDINVYLHSEVLRRSKYFAALLSDRWQKVSTSPKLHHINHEVTEANGSIESYLTVFKLLYTSDFSNVIDSVSIALSLLPIALELLFEDCVNACVRFLEAVPWTDEEEKKVLGLVPLLSGEESQDLLARLSPDKIDSSEEMLHGLILSAIHNHANMAFAKAFVAKLLRDFSSKESARRVLDRAFETSLKIVRESLEEYSSPDFRGDHNETEAIQRLNLHTAMTNGRHLLWLVERMIELKVADTAVKEWSNQASFTADLQRAFRDEAWRNIVPGLPNVVLRCTCRLANAVATGNILATKQVRMKLVIDWLPVLIICKDNISPMMANHKSLYLELEETFLRIISTLPMPDAQELLQQCLSFSTRNVEDCPHLVTAFTTWFRRAHRPMKTDNLQQ